MKARGNDGVLKGKGRAERGSRVRWRKKEKGESARF